MSDRTPVHGCCVREACAADGLLSARCLQLRVHVNSAFVRELQRFAHPSLNACVQVALLTPNREHMQLTIEHASALALAAYYTSNASYAQRSRDKIFTWFLHPWKGMLPTLRGAALIYGQTKGGRPRA